MTTLRQRVIALLTAATTALAITACSGGSTPTANGSIDVLSWWTSTSESSALSVLVDSYEKQNPGTSVDEIAVVGGGSQAHVVLATRIAHGDPPDVWQSLVGGNITAWHRAGSVGDVSPLFTDEVKAQLPENVLSSVSVDGKQYAAPLSAHRANVLMYNRDVLKGAGIAEPGAGYTLDQFLADLDALKAKGGTTPLCIGGADSISTAGLFESVLLATVGKEGWERIEADRFDWSGQEVQNALSTFGRLMDYTDATGLTSTWSEASGRLAAGECGFYQMNDSAFAESTVLNDSGATASAAPSAATNVDPSTAPSADPSVAPSAVAPDSGSSPVAATVFPGTEGTFLMVVDSFVVSSSTDNRDGANAFLTTALDPQVETDFCKVKGCVPVRNDADVSSLTPYQQQTADALRSQTVLNSISYGEVISPAMQDGFFQAVKDYVSTRDAASFNRILTERLNEGAGGPNH